MDFGHPAFVPSALRWLPWMLGRVRDGRHADAGSGMPERAWRRMFILKYKLEILAAYDAADPSWLRLVRTSAAVVMALRAWRRPWGRGSGRA